VRLPSFGKLFLLIILCPAIPVLALTPVAARRGMVVSSSSLATDAGLEILEGGGNAVDAAVAVSFALAVTYPFAGNIGGGGFMMVRMAGEPPVMVDYREEAPGHATRDMYLDKHGHIIPNASIVGARAVGVPGTVAGLTAAEQKYGKLGLVRVMQPAIRLAKEGFPVSYYLSQSLRKHQELLSKFVASRRIFLHEGNPYQPGEIFKQPELAYTLEQIAQHGPNYFYLGRVADDIVNTMKEYDGIITKDDLGQYRAIIRKPLVGQFRGDEILAPPPPSSGGVALIEMLNILGPLDLGPPDSYQSIHLIVEAMRRAYADRAAYLGDTDFSSVPVKGLTSPQYAEQLRKEILKSKPDAKVGAGNPAPFEGPNTTHFSVVDAEGDAVSNTYTLNNGYGSGVTVEGAGFLLNDEMDDFTSKPGKPNMFGLIQSEANAIAPHKRPLSSMTPVIVLQNNKVRLVLGSPGGGTIINTVLQVLLNVVVYHMDVLRAVDAPRFHDQWEPDQITYEEWGFSADTLDMLEKAGYKLHETGSLGECEAIAIDPATGWLFGAADSRGTGKAAGY
jgi:gamma-glutamyltranspeptidase/glutathione hydrolase